MPRFIVRNTTRTMALKGQTVCAVRQSWDLKIERAERHLDKIKTSMTAYASQKLYRALRASQPKAQRHISGCTSWKSACFRPDGTEIAKFGFRNGTPSGTEVNVEPSGTAATAIKIADVDGYFGMPESLEILIGWMRDSVIPEFTPFVLMEGGLRQ